MEGGTVQIKEKNKINEINNKTIINNNAVIVFKYKFYKSNIEKKTKLYLRIKLDLISP